MTTTTRRNTRPTYKVYYPDNPMSPPYHPQNHPGTRPPYQPWPQHVTTRTTTTHAPTKRRYNPWKPQHVTTTTATTHASTKRRYKPKKPQPDKCNTVYDAISMIRNELFIFRGQFLWRIGAKGLYLDKPFEAHQMWQELPENAKIDAVYENQQQKIVFFIGKSFYVFDSTTLEPGYPKPLTALGLSSSVTHIDAAFVWSHNNLTYLFSGSQYWCLDRYTGRIQLDYPRDMIFWRGIGYNIDAAFQYTDGKIYFFKNDKYWEFNDNKMIVAHNKPKLSAPKWFNCSRSMNEVDEGHHSSMNKVKAGHYSSMNKINVGNYSAFIADQNNSVQQIACTSIHCQLLLLLMITFSIYHIPIFLHK